MCFILLIESTGHDHDLTPFLKMPWWTKGKSCSIFFFFEKAAQELVIPVTFGSSQSHDLRLQMRREQHTRFTWYPSPLRFVL